MVQPFLLRRRGCLVFESQRVKQNIVSCVFLMFFNVINL
nr:MAG TPA: hypothetical protein [Caudoviricetes sp.]